MPQQNALLFDHLVGEREQLARDSQAECFSGLEIDYQLEFGRQHDRQVGGLVALENALLSLHRVRLDQQPIPLAEELDGLRLCSRAVRHRHDQLLAG